MSSIVMSNSFGNNLCQNSTQLSQTNNKIIVERIIAILSENKLKPWLDFGLKAEYERRHNQPLPEDWIQVLTNCGKDVIEVEVKSYSNGSKTLIQLPIRKAKEVSTPSTLLSDTSKSSAIEPKVEHKVVPNIVPKETIDMKSVVKPIEQSVNKSLKIGLHFTEASGVAEDVISGGKPIPAPVLPTTNSCPKTDSDFFDVFVLLAANPNNFVVIPFQNMSKDSEFYDIKNRMNEMYDNEEHRIDLPPEVISAGIYIAGQTDNCWHRMQVKTVISKEPFLVMAYMCDSGQHKTLDLKQIQPLYNCFRDLPAQALRASLATVEPLNVDWDVMTSFEFRKMVENKPFVSTVYGISEVDGQPLIALDLCDTTGADDLYICEVLVNKGLAKLRAI